jgi:2-polyprenyl-6-methoxyphenol hydroxylase-like FAD-dependent oxidoreductase
MPGHDGSGMPNLKNIPVAIVGGGPVGLMLALLLDYYGVRSVIFNAEPEVRRHPKGSTHNARTMEHHRRLGFARQIRDLCLPIDRPMDIAYYTRLTGWPLGRIRQPSEAEKRRAVAASAETDQIPEPLLRANQMYIEMFLLEQVRAKRNITVRFGWQADMFDDSAESVTVVATDGKNRESWRAQYLVGADGGRSFVRRSLALRYGGFGKLDSPHYGGRMNATYLRAPTFYRDILAHQHGWQYWTINPEARATIISLNRDDEFLVFSKGDDNGRVPTDAEMVSHVQRAVGAEIPIHVIGHWPWTAGVALVADRFVAGRVALAGDAAHLFTPTGGFGMNTGVDDASNLAWKLAALVQGWGGQRLLSSYETERRPIAQRNTVAARELNKHLASMPAHGVIEENSEAGDAARRAVGAHVATMGEEFASIGVQLGARYDGSPIIVTDDAPPADDYVRYVPSSVPGGRTPHLWLGEGRGDGDSLFDRLGRGFTLLRFGGAKTESAKPDSAPIEAAAARRRMPLAVLDLPGAEARELYGCGLAIIRPDQYVAWRGDRAPSDPDRLIAQVVGAF